MCQSKKLETESTIYLHYVCIALTSSERERALKKAAKNGAPKEAKVRLDRVVINHSQLNNERIGSELDLLLSIEQRQLLVF